MRTFVRHISVVYMSKTYVQSRPGIDVQVLCARRSVEWSQAQADVVGRLGGGVGKAVEVWVVESWLYFILVGAIVGAVCGVSSMYAVHYALKRSSVGTSC